MSDEVAEGRTHKSWRGPRLRAVLEANGVDTNKCMRCKRSTLPAGAPFVSQEEDGPAVMEIHHLDDRDDFEWHHYTRLQVLCPNCHTHTDGYKGRKKTMGTKKYMEFTYNEKPRKLYRMVGPERLNGIFMEGVDLSALTPEEQQEFDRITEEFHEKIKPFIEKAYRRFDLKKMS